MHTLCFCCDVAGRWGPCEHQYAALVQEGLAKSPIPDSSSHSAPMVPGARVVQMQADRLRAAPRTRNVQSLRRTPQPRQGRAPQASVAPDDDYLLVQALRAAGCGHMYSECRSRGISIAMLKAFTPADFLLCLNIDVAPAFAIKDFLAQQQQPTPDGDAARSTASTASSSRVGPAGPSTRGPLLTEPATIVEPLPPARPDAVCETSVAHVAASPVSESDNAAVVTSSPASARDARRLARAYTCSRSASRVIHEGTTQALCTRARLDV